jgi:hypothetical protein
MSTLFVRIAAGGVLAVAAPALPAAAPTDGSSVRGEVETHYALGIDAACTMEEVVVYGMAAVPHFDQEQLKADLREQARTLKEQFKGSIEMELKRIAAPRLDIASGRSQSAVGLPPA